PMVDVFFSRNLAGVVRQRLALLEDEPDFFRSPKLREKFLPVMLDELDRGLVQDQTFSSQGEEKRTTRFALFGAGFLSLVRVHIDQRDRCLGAIEDRIARRGEDDRAAFRQQIDSRFVPERTQSSG